MPPIARQQLWLNRKNEAASPRPHHAALDQAHVKGWIVVGMKNDWKTIFPPQHWSHAAAARQITGPAVA
jgi:hypothetical protein